MAARRQNNLAAMRLSLLHPLGTMSHGARRGGADKKNQKISKPETNNTLICKFQPLCGSKNSKEVVLQYCVLQRNMWIFHVAEISRFQSETVQSEH